jgi:hypothetical protein
MQEELTSADVAAGGSSPSTGSVIPEFRSEGIDGNRFRAAQRNGDLKTLVQLLSSEQAVEYVARQIHPWVQNPETIGALSALQIGILAYSGTLQDKINLMEAGAIEPLLDLVASKREDSAQAAVVALNFLTTDDQSACASQLANVNGVIRTLMLHAESPTVGMRAATATVLRNVCKVNDCHRALFVKLKGLSLLVGLLSLESEGGQNQANVQLEAVLNLWDIIESGSGEVIKSYAEEAIHLGAGTKLEILTTSEDRDVRESARGVLDTLRHLDD